MEGLKVMSLEAGCKPGIQCRFISRWFKIESYVPDTEWFFYEIKRNQPDVVMIDSNLYAQVDGITTTRTIRNQFNMTVIYIK